MVDRAACSHLSLSSLEPALAGEIRREPVHAEGERELAAVVQVMLQHMPDDPGARQVNLFAVPVVGEGLSHIVGTPAGQAIRHELPGAVEGLHQLGGGWDGCPQLQGNLVPTRIHLHLRAFVLAQEIGEPVGTAADDVQGILADGAQVRCGAQLKLLGGERRERPFEVILVRFPGGVERRKCEVVFSHSVYSFLLLFSQTTTKSGEKLSYYRTTSEKCSGSEDQLGPSFSSKASRSESQLSAGKPDPPPVGAWGERQWLRRRFTPRSNLVAQPMGTTTLAQSMGERDEHALMAKKQ